MGRNTNIQPKKKTEIPPTFVMPKRLKHYFTLLITSYAIVACASGLFLMLGAQVLEIEFGKFIQYPTSIPFLVNFFVAIFLIYICLMIKARVQEDQKLYREDTYLLYCMMATQLLFFNYFSFIPTLLIYLNLRKNMRLLKASYPKKTEQNKFIPVITEKVFYIICFVILGLTIAFALLLGVALLQK